MKGKLIQMHFSVQQALTQRKWGAVVLFWCNRECESNTFPSSQTDLEIPWAVLTFIYKFLIVICLLHKLKREEWLSVCILSPESKGRDYCASVEGKKKVNCSNLLLSVHQRWVDFRVFLESKMLYSFCSAVTQSQRFSVSISFMFYFERWW